MRAFLAVCAVGICAILVASPAHQAKKKKRTVLSFSLRRVKDPGASNMNAYTYLMPKGWINEDQIQWVGGQVPYPVTMLITRSPDRQYGLGYYPYFAGTAWQGPAGRGGTPLSGGADAIRMMLANAPQIGNYRVIDQMSQRIPSQFPASLAQTGADLVIQRASFTENGRAKEGVIVCKFDNAVVVDPYSRSQTWSITVLIMSSPPGKLFTNGEFLQQAATFFYSAVMTPEYFRMTNKITMASAEINRRKSLEQGEAIMKQYWDRQKKQSAANQQFSDYIRGVATYGGANGGPSYTLPYGPNHWVDQNGNVQSTSDPNFNPNVGGNGSWTQLKTGG